MTLIGLQVGLLLCSVALIWTARQLHVPYAIALVVGGFALGFVRSSRVCSSIRS